MKQQTQKAHRYWMCVCAFSLSLATFPLLQSCGDDYDDTELRDAITQIENRLKAFEDKMNTEITSLKAMIEGKVTVSSCTYDEATGSYKLLLSDGTLLNIPKSKPSVQVISYIIENGEKYWAVVAPNGELTPLIDANGKKIPVSVVAPKLQVDPNTHELQISVDGGATWQGTGAFVNESTGSLFTKVESDATNVYLTLADGTVLTVAKTSNLVCSALSGKQYFTYGETRKVKVKMQDVSKYMISKPNGWTVEFADNKLQITAPVKENVYAEVTGKVSMVAVASNGQSQIMEIAVTIDEAPLSLSFADQQVEVTLAQGNTYFNHIIGACSLKDFSLEKIVKELNGEHTYKRAYTAATYAMKDLLGVEPVPGEAYIVWTVPTAGYNESYKVEDFIFECYSSVKATVKVVSTTFEDAMLDIQVAGATKFYGTVIEKSKSTLDDVLYDLNKGWLSQNLINEAQYNGSLKKFGTRYENALKSGVTYTIYVVPVVEEKEEVVDYLMQYTAKDIFAVDVTLNPITAGGTCTTTFGAVKSQIQSVQTSVVPSSDTYKFFARYYSEAQMQEFKSDAEVIQDLLKYDAYLEIKPTALKKEGLSPDSKGYFAAVALSKDGKTGALAKVAANTKALVFNDAITLKAEVVSLGAKDVTIRLTATGGDLVNYRYINTTTKNWNYDDPTTEGKLALGDYWNYRETTATEFKIDRLNSDMEHCIFVLGFDAEGNPTHMTKCLYTPTLNINIVAKTAANWNETKPTIAGLPDPMPESWSGPVFFDVTPSAKCTKYFVKIGTKNNFQNKTAEERTKYIVMEGTEYTTAQTNLGSNYQSKSTVIGIVWVDDANNYYEAMLIDPFTGNEPAL